MKRACVIGWPISHSRSPLIHGYWLNAFGIDGQYTKEPVEPSQLEGFVKTLGERGFAGCNVTIPHKEAVCPHVEIADEATAALGAVNTIYLKNGITYGTNTDGQGFLASVQAKAPQTQIQNAKVCILGAGGSAAAIIATLLIQNVSEIQVVNRTLDRAMALQNRFGPKVKPTAWDNLPSALQDTSLLINTTSLGMTGQPPLVINLADLPQTATVADIVYVPLVTDFLNAARARGNAIVPGLGMLLHQAVPGFEKWFGRRPAVTPELYKLVASDIDPGFVL